MRDQYKDALFGTRTEIICKIKNESKLEVLVGDFNYDLLVSETSNKIQNLWDILYTNMLLKQK